MGGRQCDGSGASHESRKKLATLAREMGEITWGAWNDELDAV